MAIRVYVLGAGASVHAGYPLASELGRSLASWIETLHSEHEYRIRMSQVIDAYGMVDDFEALLADLMTCRPGSIAARLPPGVRPNLLRDLEEGIREYFDTIRVTPAPLYEQLARTLCPGNSVITFNYDLGIERALVSAKLWDVRMGYGFSIGDAQEPSPVNVFKLHGSTNWRALLFGDRPGYSAARNSIGARPVLFFQPDQAYLGFPGFVDPVCANLELASSSPGMIMPALPKRFGFATTYGDEWKPFWDCLWQRAQKAINKAQELVIIGYSLPSIDERARSLLLDSPNKTVDLTICCGADTARLEQEFRDHGFTAIRHIGDPTFEGFLGATS